MLKYTLVGGLAVVLIGAAGVAGFRQAGEEATSERVSGTSVVAPVPVVADQDKAGQRRPNHDESVELLVDPQVLAALARLGIKPTINSYLSCLARSANPDARVWCIRALSQLQVAEAFEPIAGYVDDAYSDIRVAAIVGLSAFKTPESAEILTAALRSNPEPQERAAIVSSLARIGARIGHEGLALAAKDDDELSSTRIQALLALRQAPPESIERTCNEIFDSSDIDVRATAVLVASLKLGNVAIADLVGAATEPSLAEDIQVRLARHLEDLTGESFVGDLNQTTKSAIQHRIRQWWLRQDP